MSVYTWGLGINGALGHGTLDEQSTPTKIDFFTKAKKRVKKIASGSYHTVFITDDEEMYMTGTSQDPKHLTTLFIGNNSCNNNNLTTVSATSGNNLNPISDIVSVSTPDFRKLSVAASSDTASIGSNSSNSKNNSNHSSLESSPRKFLSQSVPYSGDQQNLNDSTCANGGSSPPLLDGVTNEDQSLTNSLAQSVVVGGAVPVEDQRQPITVPIKIPLDFLHNGYPTPGSRVKQVSLGNYHIVLLTEAGNVWSWGSNSHGQLGIGLDVHSNLPRIVELKCVKQIATGVKHTAAVNEWGELYMWGINEHGELGLGDTGLRRSPTRVSKLKSELVTMISCSSTHSVCYTETGKLFSWGQCDKFGKIQTVPTLIQIHNYTEADAEGGGCGGGGPISQIVCGEWLTAALTSMGELLFWELGGKPTPIHHVLANNSIRSIAMGNFHLICLTDDGGVITLGRNKSGQLGRVQPQGEASNIPGIVKRLWHNEGSSQSEGLKETEYVLHIQAGEYHSVALVDDHPKTKVALQLLKMQRNYLRQLNILSKIYYKSMLMISTPSDPYVTSLLQLQAHNSTTYTINSGGGGNYQNSSSSNLGNNPYLTVNPANFNSTVGSSSHLERTVSNHTSPGLQPPNSITQSGSISSPSLLTSPPGGSNSHSTGTLRSRTTSIATIRGIFGLNTISHMHNDDSTISEEEVGGIFCDLNALIKTTQTFLTKLDNRMVNWDVNTMTLGDILLDETILTSFRVYIPYSDNYNSLCMTLFNAKKRSEKLTSLLKECEKRSQSYGVKLNQSLVSDMDIKSLLLAPVQTIPRLFLILKELSQNSTNKFGNDLELLNQAASKYQVLLERMNQNFQFVDAVEILNCSSNEYGNPQIMGGSLIQLVDKLTHHNISDPNFSNVFLLTCRAFTTPLALMDMLSEKYEKMPHVKGRVLNILTSWIVNHFYDFENDPIQQIIDPPDHHPSSLSYKLEDWMKSNSHNNLLNSLKKEYEKQRETPIESRLNALSVIIPTPSTTPQISLLDFTSLEIAQTITTLNHTYFAKIDKREFLNQRWTKKKAPNIQSSTEHFNRLSQFVINEAVLGKSSKHRCSIITHFIAIAQNCFELNNFTGVAAIIYGLDSAIITKWKKTWSKLSKDTINNFEYLQKIVTPLKNYISLRHIMTTVQPPCIPFLGTYLKDLTFIEDGNPSMIGGLINFYKQRKIAEVIFQIHQYQQVLYDIPCNTAIRDYFLTVPLLDDKKIQQMSSSYE